MSGCASIHRLEFSDPWYSLKGQLTVESALNLVDTLRKKIEVLGHGDHTSGLKAVLSHVEVAFRHLARGQYQKDDTAFTDAIYRTNQAFEGSIKEAYRVLAGKDPTKKTPFSIEEYLENKSVFRERVLNQFKTYRTEWRNPSAHDYKLDFDENEAFLAIITVSAFACLLSDQIAEKLSFETSKITAASLPREITRNAEAATFFDQVSALLLKFVSEEATHLQAGNVTEAQIVGALHGIFDAIRPDIEVALDPRLAPDSKYRADLVLTDGNEKIIVEVKRLSRSISIAAGREQVERYLEVSGLKKALLVYVPDKPEAAELLRYHSDQSAGEIGIILPQSANKR